MATVVLFRQSSPFLHPTYSTSYPSNARHAVALYCLYLVVIVIAWYSKTQVCADTIAILHTRALVFQIKMGMPLATTIGQPSRTRGNSNGNINDHFDMLSVSVSFAIIEVGQAHLNLFANHICFVFLCCDQISLYFS
ncbi:hypothetical protein CY34DRAFT_802147 [Suillus luteus UH-Slu-Lm8-n1]|uniref:Uncharacterized protein n=1 Tax=Suillus luteus UH-Slu-Lm8-n1 TaxID=930992 RepID=A0A0D0BFN4_9AGAM|nr:hypothetical protein CY34DRAFT_802147 [Suillus luteus UH-Slu-Lm8-n1]